MSSATPQQTPTTGWTPATRPCANWGTPLVLLVLALAVFGLSYCVAMAACRAAKS